MKVLGRNGAPMKILQDAEVTLGDLTARFQHPRTEAGRAEIVLSRRGSTDPAFACYADDLSHVLNALAVATGNAGS